MAFEKKEGPFWDAFRQDWGTKRFHVRPEDPCWPPESQLDKEDVARSWEITSITLGDPRQTWTWLTSIHPEILNFHLPDRLNVGTSDPFLPWTIEHLRVVPTVPMGIERGFAFREYRLGFAGLCAWLQIPSNEWPETYAVALPGIYFIESTTDSLNDVFYPKFTWVGCGRSRQLALEMLYPPRHTQHMLRRV